MAARNVKVVLVEVPGVALELDGAILGEVTLNHAKYTQILLAANLTADPELGLEFTTQVVDLKASSPVQMTWSRAIPYCGRELGVWRVGAPNETLAQHLNDTDIVGISANFTFERNSVAETISFVKSSCSALVVVGGHDATAAPRYYLERGADVCVLGEGESAIPDIASASLRGELENVRGIAYLDRGDLRKNGKRRQHDLDSILYPTEAILRSRKFDECPDGPVPSTVSPAFAVMETSRGCDEKCSFCDSSYIVGSYRCAHLEVLRRQLATLKCAGIQTVLFADDNLLYRTLPSFGGNGGREELLQFFDLLFGMGFAWTFYNGIQFGLLEKRGKLDNELISILFRNAIVDGRLAGCFRAYIPLEKFTPAEMVLLPKLKPLDVEAEILTAISRCGVPELNLGFIIGTPRETPASLAQTLQKAEEFGELVDKASGGCSLPRFFPWCSIPLPGTPDHRYFSSNILYPESEFPEIFNNYTSPLKTTMFSPLDLTLERARLSRVLNKGRLKLRAPKMDGDKRLAVPA